jgi:hypothetical protein
MKWADMKTWVTGDFVSNSMERQNVNMLTNMHYPLAEGNFCNEHGNNLKPTTVQYCNRRMGHVNKSDIMNTYSISR